MWFKKKLKHPAQPEIDSDVLHTWVVSWQSRHGIWNTDTKPEYEVFIDEDKAIEFKKALEAAFKLIRHTSRTKVTITPRQDDKD